MIFCFPLELICGGVELPYWGGCTPSVCFVRKRDGYVENDCRVWITIKQFKLALLLLMVGRRRSKIVL